MRPAAPPAAPAAASVAPVAARRRAMPGRRLAARLGVVLLLAAVLAGPGACTWGNNWPGPGGVSLPQPPRKPRHPPPPPNPNAPRLEVRENRFDNGALRTHWQVLIEPDGRTVRHGPLRRYHPNGRLAVVGQYRNGRASGVWRWYDERGNLLRKAVPQQGYDEILVGRNLADPRTVYRDAKGRKVAAGLRKHDKPHGEWTYYFPGGAVRAQGRYLDGLPDGRWVFYFRTGQVQRREDYKLGVPDGTVMRGWPNGQEQLVGQVEQGVRVGLWRTWYENGQTESAGEFHEDRQDGEWRYWDEQGHLVRHVRFRAGAVAAELPLPQPRTAVPRTFNEPELLPFRPRIYSGKGNEIRLEDETPVQNDGNEAQAEKQAKPK